MSSKVIPAVEDIDRLIALQHNDRGFFVLALYSFIEGYLRSRFCLGYEDAGFYDLVYCLRDDLKTRPYPPSYTEIGYLLKLPSGREAANRVRHTFEQLSAEEVCAAVFRFKQFARLNNFYSTGRLALLDEKLEVWKTRKPSGELSVELDRALATIQTLSQQNIGLSSQVAQFDTLTKELLHFEKRDALLTSELADLKAKTKVKDERYDEMRREKHEAQTGIKKEMESLHAQIGELTQAKEYLDALSRVSVYTRTRFDYEQSLIRLTSEQKKILDQIKLKKDFLIKGSAGTGKSLVLVKALEKALAGSASELGLDENDTVALLTYTNSLVSYTSYIATLLDLKINIDFISTVDKFFIQRFKSLFPNGTVAFKQDDLLPYFETENDKATLGLSSRELLQEAEVFIWANLVTREEYVEKMIERTGMKKAIRSDARLPVWEAIERAASRMKVAGVLARTLAALEVVKSAHRLAEDQKVDFVFIDEVQDLPAVILAALKKCARRAVILAGDADQSIYQSGFSWKRAGIDIGGRTRILHTNFRNTIQLHDFADRYRKTIPHMDSDNTSESFRLGPSPECSTGKGIEDLYELILQKVHICLDYLSYDPENICIIAPRKDHLTRLALDLKERYELHSAIIGSGNFDFAETGVIRLSTMHSSKGLDFPVVLFLLDHRPLFQGAYDDAAQDRMARNLIYVSITRAMEHLHVFTLEDAMAEAITDL